MWLSGLSSIVSSSGAPADAIPPVEHPIDWPEQIARRKIRDQGPETSLHVDSIVIALRGLLWKRRKCSTFCAEKEAAMKSIAGALAAGMLLCCNPASADEIDLTAWSCKKFMSASKEDVGVILAWLDGFYTDEDDPPAIDTGKLVTNAKKLAEYCAAHPNDHLIDAADKLFKPAE
jgi:acid stress chaperone HdeB